MIRAAQAPPSKRAMDTVAVRIDFMIELLGVMDGKLARTLTRPALEI